VPVTTSLLSKDQREGFALENREKQRKLRDNFLGGPKKETLTIAEARAAGPKLDWENYTPPVPSFLGTRTCGPGILPGARDAGEARGTARDFLRELSHYIDWTPFFHAWELRGVWDREAKVLKTKNAEGAAEAAKLYQDAIAWVERIIVEERFHAQGIYGFFPANAVGDDIIVWTDDRRATERMRFHTLRQQLKKDSGKPNVALADWVAPGVAGDYIGGFVVGIPGADEFAAEMDAAHDPYGSIMIKAIADRFAEAFAEYLHHKARVEWGYETEEELTTDQLIHENYRGIRPAPGYPAQPDHTEKPPLFALLGAPDATGVTLTESCAMHPGAAVCGLYFSHPESHYFALSELQKDQIEDYARRKGIPLQEAERWLAPWLGYV
jgi:5-methyltetrahydrofolate--homocysteine methyltransferase